MNIFKLIYLHKALQPLGLTLTPYKYRLTVRIYDFYSRHPSQIPSKGAMSYRVNVKVIYPRYLPEYYPYLTVL